MNRAIVGLLFLLLVQLGLVALWYWPQDEVASGARPLLPPSSAIRIDEIQIADNRDSEVILNKVHGQWILTELQDLPADGQRIQSLLDTLSLQALGFPVAESAAARQRFRVSSYRYQRRLIFLAEGEPLETIYLGRSPAYRMVYARNGAYPAVFSLRYNNHDAPVSASAWLDPGLLQLADIEAIATGKLSLRRDHSGQWRNARGDSPSPRAMNALLTQLAGLQVTGLAAPDMQRSLAEEGRPATTFRVERSGAAPVRLELFHEEGGYYAHDSRYGPFFRLSARQYLQLLALDSEELAGDRGA